MEEKRERKMEVVNLYGNWRNMKAGKDVRKDFWDAGTKFFSPTTRQGHFRYFNFSRIVSVVVWLLFVIVCGIVSSLIIIKVANIQIPNSNDYVTWILVFCATGWPGALLAFLTGLLFQVIFKQPDTIHAFAYLSNQPILIQSTAASYSYPTYQYINIPPYY
jgi:hypothetical protein